MSQASEEQRLILRTVRDFVLYSSLFMLSIKWQLKATLTLLARTACRLAFESTE